MPEGVCASFSFFVSLPFYLFIVGVGDWCCIWSCVHPW